MSTLPRPESNAINSWFVFKCVNIISDREYARFVNDAAGKGVGWAQNMLSDTEAVENYIASWCKHMDLVAKRENSGISKVCKNIQGSLPIAKKHCVFTLQDCVLTGMKGRPCFEIISSKDSSSAIHVHHSALEKCQALWALYNKEDILASSMKSFSEGIESKNLAHVCNELNRSELKATLIDYFDIVFNQIKDIFQKENLFQGQQLVDA